MCWKYREHQTAKRKDMTLENELRALRGGAAVGLCVATHNTFVILRTTTNADEVMINYQDVCLRSSSARPL